MNAITYPVHLWSYEHKGRTMYAVTESQNVGEVELATQDREFDERYWPRMRLQYLGVVFFGGTALVIPPRLPWRLLTGEAAEAYSNKMDHIHHTPVDRYIANATNALPGAGGVE